LEIWSEGENLLKRPSEFVCKMKFFNTLPDVPSEAKLAVVALPLEEFGVFHPTSLQHEHKHEVVVGNDLALQVVLMCRFLF
jgi:hypothetical protein